VSWRRRSKEELDNTTPESPPNVKREIKPNTQRRRGCQRTTEPLRDNNQEKTLIPVGIAITIVAVVK